MKKVKYILVSLLFLTAVKVSAQDAHCSGPTIAETCNTSQPETTADTKISQLAQYDGAFLPLKKAGDAVIAREAIGKVYYGGVWNTQFAPASGVLTYVLGSGAQTEQNTTTICTVAIPAAGIAAR